jgi:hypothetical protein
MNDMRQGCVFLVLVLLLGMVCGCSSTKEQVLQAPPPAVSNVKIRVVDVNNKTTELFDVDVLGMMWTALDNSLKKRGMFWTRESGEMPLAMDVSITRYQPGNAWIRPILPFWGKTVLAARCELKQEGRTIASAEAKKEISLGSDVFTRGAWQKIFAAVAEDLVSEVTRGL